MDTEDRLEKYVNYVANSPVKAALIALTVLVGLGIFTNFLTTLGTVASAPGKIIQKTLQTNNIIQSYEWFYDVNASYDARLSQVQQFTGLMVSETDQAEKRRLRIDLAAMQQTCRDLATKYNANSQKMNKSMFKGWSLPDTLNRGECE